MRLREKGRIRNTMESKSPMSRLRTAKVPNAFPVLANGEAEARRIALQMS